MGVAEIFEQSTGTKLQAESRTAVGEVDVEQVRIPTMAGIEEMVTIENLSTSLDIYVWEKILDEVEAVELSADFRDIVEDDGVLGDRNLFT